MIKNETILRNLRKNCDHDWEYQDTSQGDGIYYLDSGHDECLICGLAKEREYEDIYEY